MRVSHMSALLLPALALALPNSLKTTSSQDTILATATPAQPIIATLSQPTNRPSTLETSYRPAETDALSPDRIELRQATTEVEGATTTAATQMSPITIFYLETTVNGVSTYELYTYSQVFASVPMQGASAGVGSIGLGTDSSS